MDTATLKTFAQKARVDLIHQVGARLKLVLASDSLERREHMSAVLELENRIEQKGKDVVVDEVAYTWFNRFCALRFMDVNLYNPVGVVSPAEAQIQPEILSEAKNGLVDSDVVSSQKKQKILDLLSGKLPSKDAQGEVYRLLLVSYCNHLNIIMQFLFEKITDYTEILLPTGLLAVNSVLADCRKALTEESCKDVEVIGWLYQFYISERKDEVFKNFKKGKKAGPREIPAATQLFTPHWIVRYLVENSLGRLWMLNHPRSQLTEKMEYYIKPEQDEADFLKINKPEEIKVCDPACGSGHMLTYAFDLLYSIYEEEGYEPSSIPTLILKHNLYGIEIDERAGELAAFALTMKARQKSRRFFNKPIEPNICVLKNVKIKPEDLKEYVNHVGIDLFSEDVLTMLNQFEEADNFGSLIIPAASNAGEVLNALSQKNMEGEMFLSETHEKVLTALMQAEYLSQRYHVVVANPPYMGGGNMNGRLSAWLKDNYADVKSDLFSAFIIRNTYLAIEHGQLGFMSPYVWMFISSYEKLRQVLIGKKTITSLIQLEYSGFDGATVPICTFTIENAKKSQFKGGYIRLSDFRGSENQAPKALDAIKNTDCGWFYRVSADDFQKIPGSPIAYWVSRQIINLYSNNLINSLFEGKEGVGTRNDDCFLRMVWEVSKINIARDKRWILTDKAGDFRKWFMGISYLMDWEKDGYRIKNYRNVDGSLKSRPQNVQYLFREGVSWGKVGSGLPSFRWRPAGIGFNDAAPTLFGENVFRLLGQLNSIVTRNLLQIRGCTLNITTGVVAEIPILSQNGKIIKIEEEITKRAITLSIRDWDSYETSWDFTSLPLLDFSYRGDTLSSTYETLRSHWNEMVLEMQRLEEENNRIFIDAYGLQDELTSDVPLKEITLTCNPHYRYGNNKSESELEALLLDDTMKELISYAVGCMFGRYSIDKPGLILANQGETYEDYCRLVPDSTFPADSDNAIPVLDSDWFPDDIVSRFRKFLRVTFGEERYEENLRFVEASLGKDLRQYFLRDFYNDHVRRYKKRPIFWMFSSPDGSFNTLIYMHRYSADTASIVLNEYLREYQVKLSSYMESLRRKESNPNLSKGEKVKALKELDKLSKTQDVLTAYERDVLFPLATQKIEIDLDDGVKVNYPKFGNALKKIAGLEAKEEE